MRKPRSESQIPKHWLTKARADLGSAEILFREHGPTDTVCFLCQQAVEKYLKGFLTDIPVSYSRQEAQEAIKIAKEMIASIEKKKIEID